MQERKKDGVSAPFAFISYSQKDKEIGTKILSKIENYVYPVKWVEESNRPNDPKYVRPIFLDLQNLSVIEPKYQDELDRNIVAAKYLIVLCSSNSANSLAVRHEIDLFLQTHHNNSDLILPVYVDKVFKGMHPVVDEIMSNRNCPIYINGRGKAEHDGRRYCYYHIYEFLLKVEFSKLYNRYVEYKRRKRRLRFSVIFAVLAIIFSCLVYGYASEQKRAETAEALAVFESKTFPFSLVVGYVDNFLMPLMQNLEETGKDYHIVIFLPYAYSQLENLQRRNLYSDQISSIFGTDSVVTAIFKVPNRSRDISIAKLSQNQSSKEIYFDNANTVIAFKAVIDYKMDSKNNPVSIPDTEANRDKMVMDYANEFMDCVDSWDALKPYVSHIHFIRTNDDCQCVLKEIML